jgi:hypothetical protein
LARNLYLDGKKRGRKIRKRKQGNHKINPVRRPNYFLVIMDS